MTVDTAHRTLVQALVLRGTPVALEVARCLERCDASPAGSRELLEELFNDARAHGVNPLEIYPPTPGDFVVFLEQAARDILAGEYGD